MNWYKMAQQAGIYVWLDDIRDPNNLEVQKRFGSQPGMVWAKTVDDAIKLLEQGNVVFIDFDHDLGEENKDGYDLAKWIEQMAYENKLKPFKWTVHSLNPSGAKMIEQAMRSAERFWEQQK